MHTDYGSLLKATGLPLPKIAELAGLSVDTVRSISSGRTVPRRATRSAIADALRRHSVSLLDIAGEIDGIHRRG